MEGFKASSSCGRPFSPPLILKIELPYKREHDFQDFSEPQNDAFWAVILTPFCSQHPAKDYSSAPPPRAKTYSSALTECRTPPELSFGRFHFDTILLSAPCQRLLKCSLPPWQNLPSALRECRIPPEVSPSLLWQSPWDHFAASEATLASPAPPFGAKIPPKVTSKWLSKAILTSLFNDFGDASFWIQNRRYLLNEKWPGRVSWKNKRIRCLQAT